MARFPVAFNASKNKFYVKPADAKDTQTHKIVGELSYLLVGEEAQSEAFPAPIQHLQSLAAAQGITTYGIVTVDNRTGETELDFLNKTPSEEYLKAYELKNQTKVVKGSGNSEADIADDEESEDADDDSSTE